MDNKNNLTWLEVIVFLAGFLFMGFDTIITVYLTTVQTFVAHLTVGLIAVVTVGFTLENFVFIFRLVRVRGDKIGMTGMFWLYLVVAAVHAVFFGLGIHGLGTSIGLAAGAGFLEWILRLGAITSFSSIVHKYLSDNKPDNN